MLAGRGDGEVRCVEEGGVGGDLVMVDVLCGVRVDMLVGCAAGLQL